MIEQASLVIGEGNWAVKSDSLLGYKINNGKYYPREMSVVRATTGTRINEDGLVEVVPYNLLTYSEQFDNAVWNGSNATRIANETTAPNGTLTADKLLDDATSGLHRVLQSYTTDINTTYTFSCYVKKAELNYVILSVGGSAMTGGGGSGADLIASVDLTNGSIVTNNYNISVVSFDNGWYRVSIRLTTDSNGGSFFPYIATSQNGITGTYAGTGQGIFVWGAQLVEGSSALDYLPTTDRLDVARIDYSSGSAALLVEPQRTNLALYSSSFDNAAWTKVATNVTTSSVVSPDGNTNAYTLTANGTTTEHQLRSTGLISLTSGTTYTTSIFAKAGTNNFIQFVGSGSPYPSTTYANFDLGTGTLGDKGANVTSSIVDYGNGWYRCSMTAEATATTTINTFLLDIVTSKTSVRGEANSLSTNVHIWGAQLEAGSYPTSLIPTQGSTVTRNADVISKTGIADLIGQTEGTMFVDFVFNMVTNDYAYISIQNSSALSRVRIVYTRSTNTMQIDLIIGGSSSAIYTFNPLNLQRYKIAIAYKSGDSVAYINGSQVGTQSATFTFTDLSSLNFDNPSAIGTEPMTGKYNATALFKTRLTNAELATLTTI